MNVLRMLNLGRVSTGKSVLTCLRNIFSEKCLNCCENRGQES